jgi:Caspase domain
VKWWSAILLLFGTLFPGAASAQTTRGLFVGVDAYRYAKSEAYPNATFNNLSGAVVDTVTFKNVLREVHRIPLDKATKDSCVSSNEISTTLTDDCATRDAILAALETLIAKSAPKDTLLFYFAGHGAQFADDEKFNQASGYNGTILPTDARKPGAETEGDIFDFELKAIKERAVAKGIFFVTIFDSCNSASATRDAAMGQSRNVAVLTGKLPVRSPPPAATGPGGGYWVHLAAAQDGEQAHEVSSGEVGARVAGVFTTALSQSMRANRNATFGDLIRDIRARVAASGQASQTPAAEGELRASLGSGAQDAVTFDVSGKNGQYGLNAGALSGITPGSVFALYATQNAAFAANAIPLAIGRVVSIEDYKAKLEVENKSGKNLPDALVALETQHAFGNAVIRVANMATVANEKAAINAAIARIAFAKIVANPSVQIVTDETRAGIALLKTRDGQLIGALGKYDDPNFADNVRIGLKKVLRVEQLLKLARGSDLRFCIAHMPYDPPADACPAKERRDLRVLKANSESLVTVHNTAAVPRFVYVFGIDPSYGVALVLPKPGAIEPALEQSRAYRDPADPLLVRVPGTYRFVTIATREPINAAALEQGGIARRGASSCNTALEEILCAATSGTRGGTSVKASDWSAIIETVIVE